MKLSQELCDAYNEQISKEYKNALSYAQISSFFEDFQLSKLASYFMEQSKQEEDHARMFIKHVNDRIGGKVTIFETPQPTLSLSDWKSVGNEFIRIEQETTESIESLYDMALNEKSFIDLPFISSMLSEQVEEEDIALKFQMNISMVSDIVLFNNTFGG